MAYEIQSIKKNSYNDLNELDLKDIEFNTKLTKMKGFYVEIPHKEIISHYLINFYSDFFNKCDSCLEDLIKKNSKKKILDITTNSYSNLFKVLNEKYEDLNENFEHINYSELFNLSNNSNQKFDLIYSDHIFFNDEMNYTNFLKDLSKLLKPSGVYLANEHFDKLDNFYKEFNVSNKSNFLLNYNNRNFLKKYGFNKIKKIAYFEPPYAENDDFVFYQFKK